MPRRSREQYGGPRSARRAPRTRDAFAENRFVLASAKGASNGTIAFGITIFLRKREEERQMNAQRDYFINLILP